MSLLLPLLFWSSVTSEASAQPESAEGTPDQPIVPEGAEQAEQPTDVAVAEEGDVDSCSDSVDIESSYEEESVDSCSADAVYTPSDEDTLSSQQRSASLWGNAPASNVPTLSSPSEALAFDTPIDMPAVANTKENKFAAEISGYQNQLSRVLQMALQVKSYAETIHRELGENYDPTTLVDGAVGENDIQALKVFVELFDPNTSLKTSWGVDGYSKEVISLLQEANGWVDQALQIDDQARTDVMSQVSDMSDDGSLDVGGAGVMDWDTSDMSNDGDAGQDVLAAAYKYDGASYGTGRGEFDCVTFVERALKDAGFDDLDHQQMMCISKPGKLESNVENDAACIQGAPRALIDAGQGYEVSKNELRPGCVIQYWYYNRAGELCGHAGIVKGVQEDGYIEIYGAHASRGGVDSKVIDINSPSIVKVYAAMPQHPQSAEEPAYS